MNTENNEEDTYGKHVRVRHTEEQTVNVGQGLSGPMRLGHLRAMVAATADWPEDATVHVIPRMFPTGRDQHFLRVHRSRDINEEN